MKTSELQKILTQGEDSRHQFKANITNVNALAAEFVAFSNAEGGYLLIGISDDGSMAGLTPEDIQRLNQLVSNAASQSVRPPINPFTENLSLLDGMVMVVKIERGISKPYMDNQGVIWVKSGADKRKVTAREELQRMYQSAALLHADETPVAGSRVEDLDSAYFDTFLQKAFEESLAEQAIELGQLLENMNLMRDGCLNISALLLFGKQPQFRLPTFIVKAVFFPGNSIDALEYLDSQDISGRLAEVFQQSLSFVMRNLHHRQAGQSVNSLGQLEVPRIVFEELLANALIHRDYFISAPVRLLIFKNRIEIISPGHLPNNLTIANIKRGNSNIRNPVLASFATRLLPYRGLGSGISRALKAWSQIEFEDDREGNQFKVTIFRDLANNEVQ
ncbi:putative DNA binding domain-containing protein [Candidatus Venteria ishoeyi]|uniref:RNA-binding domain-containing protein n=1 Tax=Candidatus Venteria ishoeyi TaxID=1899563 RepID=UPI0025A51784|nr:RNA-binding domain-containing protein [Candidatus Venteria ishoeyi]MDM8548233.1 putative DNA binding domain-containing protein [Candidatus Venteria ishoeyi]